MKNMVKHIFSNLIEVYSMPPLSKNTSSWRRNFMLVRESSSMGWLWNKRFKTKDAVQWKSACLAHVRHWVWSPEPQKIINKCINK
jgi:hypothetical protein